VNILDHTFVNIAMVMGSQTVVRTYTAGFLI